MPSLVQFPHSPKELSEEVQLWALEGAVPVSAPDEYMSKIEAASKRKGISFLRPRKGGNNATQSDQGTCAAPNQHNMLNMHNMMQAALPGFGPMGMMPPMMMQNPTCGSEEPLGTMDCYDADADPHGTTNDDHATKLHGATTCRSDARWF